MFKPNVHKILIVLAMTAAVAACGGGGSGGGGGGGVAAPASPAPATSNIPASALLSVDGLIAFMNQLIDTATNETSEPINLGDAALPVDDTA